MLVTSAARHISSCSPALPPVVLNEYVALTGGISLTSDESFSLASLREGGALSVIAAAATAAAAVHEGRVVRAGERERLRRRPGDRERERERGRAWKPAAL